MGREEAVSYWERYGEEFEMVLVTEKGEILVTEGICEEFETEEEYLVID